MTEFDPAWEYYEPDPEVEYCVYARSCRGSTFDRVWDRRLAQTQSLGLRFGHGNPDRAACFHLAPPRPPRASHAPLPEWDKCAECAGYFRKSRRRSKVCSRACQSARHARLMRTREPVTCRCGVTFTPVFTGQALCSRACVAKSQRRVVQVEAGRCQNCGTPLVPSQSRNAARVERKYCSRRCKHAATCRRVRASAAAEGG